MRLTSGDSVRGDGPSRCPVKLAVSLFVVHHPVLFIVILTPAILAMGKVM